jgi:dUTP pyrophosphatase
VIFKSGYFRKKNIMQIRFQKLHPEAVLPRLAYTGDLGIDVHTLRGFVLAAHSQSLVDTGLQLEIPVLPGPWQEHFQLGCFVWSKSGLSVKSNIEKGAGVIDPNYTGELKIKLYNHGDSPRTFAAGDKVAQLVFQVCARITTVVEADLSHHLQDSQNLRGHKGFGSSGEA